MLCWKRSFPGCISGSEKKLGSLYPLCPPLNPSSFTCCYSKSTAEIGLLRAQEVTKLIVSYILRKNRGDGWDENERRKTISAQDHKLWAIHWTLSEEWAFTIRPLAHNRWQSVCSVISHPGGLCSVYTTLCTYVKIWDFIQYTESFIYLIPRIKDERIF